MVQVSEIENVRGKVKIVFDDGTSYILLKSMLREKPIQVGQMLDEQEFSNWVLKKQFRSALDKAVGMLAARAHSKAEIAQSLQKTGYTRETIQMVLFKLDNNHLLNDHEFAHQWVNYRKEQKYGPRRIIQELRRKGISREDAEEAVDVFSDEEQMEEALAIAKKTSVRLKTSDDPYKARQKVIATLVRRGFDWEIARTACEAVFSCDN